MRRTLIFLLVLVFYLNSYAQISDNAVIPPHPRLLLRSGEEQNIKRLIASDPRWALTHQSILDDCNAMLSMPLLKKRLKGKRLLEVSRECLHRVFYLSYAYRITQDVRYLKRAEAEMVNVSSFDDWNPAHFLDVGEMTMALAIGYDWLYDGIAEDSKKAISEAILKKGIQTSMDTKYNSWLRVNYNWNQVCNSGVGFGALATYELHPALSKLITERALQSIRIPMHEYGPDGVYTEGFGYWNYGTSYNVAFISALETVFKSDFGLLDIKGFDKTPYYIENMTGATGQPFNYFDSGDGNGPNPAMYWFAGRNNDPSLLWIEKSHLVGDKSAKDRFLPALMVWAKDVRLDRIAQPQNLVWVGHGKNPVALIRTSWNDKDAVFVGIKGGSPSLNHAHMDAGSFVLDAEGERWAIDLGPQNYESLESKGVDLWNEKQNSQRWQVLRYNNLAHNTLAFDGKFQLVSGNASIVSHSDIPKFMNAVVDLSGIYKDASDKVTRGIAIVNKQYVIVRDEVEMRDTDMVMRWSMVTKAKVSVINDRQAVLTQDGKSFQIDVSGPSGTRVKTWSAAPVNSFDAPNPGITIVGYEVKIPARQSAAITVYLLPEKVVKQDENRPLADWPSNE